MHHWSLPLAVLAAICVQVNASSSHNGLCSPKYDRPRIFVLSDIENEPDDAQSFVRLLTYANRLQIEGVVASTSFHLNSSTHPERMVEIIGGYSEVLPNLKQHEQGWPDPEYLLDKVKSGLPVYGMDGVGPDKDSDGSELLISAVDSSVDDLWVTIWGGASVLAQALFKVRSERNATELDAFTKKIKVYSISDQDNTGAWIRREFPQLFYIASIHRFTHYGVAAWTGISGEKLLGYEGGPDSSVISMKWLAENIQSVSPLGALYPDPEFIVEGDTPSFLYLIPNGLSVPTMPEWGSWGGRYGPVNWGEGHQSDTADSVIGKDGKTYVSNSATVWRWRRAFQNDFAARMRWSAADRYEDANHHPVIVLDSGCDLAPTEFDISLGQTVHLDAERSYDPDGDSLSFHWWQYKEPTGLFVPELVLSGTYSSHIQVRLPGREEMAGHYNVIWGDKDTLKRDLHIILEVSDGSLTSYHRFVAHVNIPGFDLIGGLRDEL